MHTNIMIFILLEAVITFRQYPLRRNGVTALSIFMAGYLVWVHIVRYYSGLWVYPVLDVLNWPQRIVFYAVNIVAGSLFYFGGEFLNNLVWRVELKRVVRGSGQSDRLSRNE